MQLLPFIGNHQGIWRKRHCTSATQSFRSESDSTDICGNPGGKCSSSKCAGGNSGTTETDADSYACGDKDANANTHAHTNESAGNEASDFNPSANRAGNAFTNGGRDAYASNTVPCSDTRANSTSGQAACRRRKQDRPNGHCSPGRS